MVNRGYDGSGWSIFSAYIVLGFFGTLGNSFILYVIIKRRMNSTTFWLVGNQAVSDLACGLLYLSVWFTCSSSMLGSSTGGLLTCEVAYTLKVSTFFVSCWTMMAISLERYLKLYYPHSNGCSPLPSISATWICGVLTAVFAMFKFRASEFFTSERLVGCRWGYANSPALNLPFFSKHHNMIVLIIVGLFLPITITSISYYKVILKLKERKLGKLQRATLNGGNLKEVKEKQRRRTTRMLISTVLCYVILCSPLYVLFVTDYFVIPILTEECNSSTHEPWYFLLAYFLCVFSICINPVIYCYYNQQFRSEAVNLFKAITGQGWSGKSEAQNGKILTNIQSNTSNEEEHLK